MEFGHWITNRKFGKIDHSAPWMKGGWGYWDFDRRGTDLAYGEGLVAFRRKFARGDCDKITLRITALGVFEAFVNGERVGNKNAENVVYDEMKPGWTDYRKHVIEFEYDITDACRAGENCLVVTVANGWWSGRISYGFYGFRGVGLCCEILKSTDGKVREVIASDGNFETSVGGRVRYADIWNGEYYDGRAADIASESGAYTWTPADLYDEINTEIVPIIGEPVRIRKAGEKPVSAVVWEGILDNGTEHGEIKASSCRVGDGCEKGSLKAGEHLVLDMGYNRTGRARLRFTAERGTTIRVYCAEMLNDSGSKARGNDGPKGSAYLSNYRSALSRVMVISGGGEEEFTPLYTFYAYRYLEIVADADIGILSVTTDVIGSDFDRTGKIETDNAEINQLIGNVIRGMDSNYVSIPTDCPQRDERLGWTCDTEVFCGSAMYLGNVKKFLEQWMLDMRDSQDEIGAFCCVAPRVWSGSDPEKFAAGNAGAAWLDAAILLPYKVWKMYGDKRILEDNFDAMEKYMKFLIDRRGLDGGFPIWGDWLSYEETPKEFVSVCYFGYDATLMGKIATILGKPERAAFYDDLAIRARKHFCERYTDGKEITMRTQTGYLLPLAFDLIDGEMREKIIRQLREKIRANNFTLSTGFVGTAVLCDTLTDIGLVDEAYSLLLQTNDPSWLYSVRQGATTVWERWNSYTLDRGFGQVNMNSFNHYAYGAVVEWMFTRMAGIRSGKNAGFRDFLLAPHPDTRTELPAGQERIGSVKAEYLSEYGKICAAWEYRNGRFVYSVSIPEGTSATVVFPLLSGQSEVTVNGRRFDATADGFACQNGNMTFRLGAGKYEIL